MCRRSVLAVAGLALVLAGCSGAEEPTEPEQSPTEQLAVAKTAFDAAKTVELDLSSRDVPPRENGVLPEPLSAMSRRTPARSITSPSRTARPSPSWGEKPPN